MGIRFHCHHCQHELHVKDFQGGKRGRCPACQGKFRIPLQDAEHSLDADQLAEDELMTVVAVQGQKPVGRKAAEQTAIEQKASSATASSEAETAVRVPAAAPLPPQPVASAPGLPRAIAEAPSAIWHVRPTTGGQYGPAPAETLGQWLIEGRIARDALVWRDDWAEWQLAGDSFAEYYGPPGQTIAVAGSTAGQAASGGAGSSLAPPSQPSSIGSRNRLDRKQQKRRRYIWLLSILTVLFIGLVVALSLVLWMPG